MPASKESQWKPEEDTLIRKMVGEGKMLKDMAVFLPGRTRRGVECRVSNLGLKSGNPRTKHSKDENFWEIPNALNSYYAGLAAADMSLNKSRFCLAWECSSKDQKYMQKFVEHTKYTGKIFNRFKDISNTANRMQNKSLSTIPKMSEHSFLRIASAQKWYEDMEKHFNLVPNKTHRLRPPNIHSDYLKCCYILGLLDGDGALSFSKTKMTLHIAYGSASKDIVYWVREFVDNKFPFNMRENKIANVSDKYEGKYYRISIYGIKAVKFIDFMRRIEVPRFIRKWDNPEILAIIESYRLKWPEFFTSEQELTFDSSENITWAKNLQI